MRSTEANYSQTPCERRYSHPLRRPHLGNLISVLNVLLDLVIHHFSESPLDFHHCIV